MAARAARLKYTGHWIERKDADGNIVVSGPSESFPGIPARDLTEDDIKALSDAEYRDAVDSGLYVAPAASKPAGKSSSKKAAAKKPAAKPVSAEEASAEQATQVAEADAGGSDADGSGAES
jgi:hypothetical protein